MKVVHLCLACFFPDGYSYQENLLPKFHKKMGNDVEVIASLLTFGPNGEKAFMDGPSTYVNENGINVVRLAYYPLGRVAKKLQLFNGLRNALEKSAPDVLFIHGCQFLDIFTVVSYVKKHPDVQVFVDNHADYSNSATNWLSKIVLHRIIWRSCAQAIAPYAAKFWGVLPARVDFLVENYGIRREQCDLLVMGADDEEVSRASSAKNRIETRTALGISESDFLVVTGGKIDSSKTQVFSLINAIKSLPAEAKLLVFGPVALDMKEAFAKVIQDEKIVYVPWASTQESYDYFSAADLVCFPGRHSVYWEQAVAMGKPLLVKKWDGAEHVNACNNVLFLENDSESHLYELLNRLISDKECFAKLKENAKKAAKGFMYSAIAERAIKITE